MFSPTPCNGSKLNGKATSGLEGRVPQLQKASLAASKSLLFSFVLDTFQAISVNFFNNSDTRRRNILSQNLVCHVTGIVYKVEEFRTPISVMQCYNYQCFGHSAKTCRSKQECLICGGNHTHKGCPSKESRKPTCANCNGPHVASYKGCPEYKKQAFRQHVVNNQKTYVSVVFQNTLPQFQTSQTFNFTAEQLTKFVANVVIQIAQPQVCYPNPKQDTLDLKSSICRKVLNAAKNILGFDITGKDLFESIGSISAPAPPPPSP